MMFLKNMQRFSVKRQHIYFGKDMLTFYYNESLSFLCQI